MLYEDKIFNDFVNKRKGEINALSKQIDFSNLTDNFKGENLAPINFVALRGPLHLYKNIFNGDATIKKAEEDQEKLKLNLSHIKSGNPKDKTEEQSKVIKNIKTLYESREKVIEVFNDYSRLISESINKEDTEKDLKY